ncbi:hypothetical protein AAFF_G00406870 [Aldrovandia affinis]|uniref:Uncharacterized protein n=1 Tax=Aldrovandia affinis TaxID=143900 RepID=A0AAD7WK84_9TELE|nr:hypothetical protein AAFF_G00406870 [Aldrovandia affinis]
MRLVAAPIKSVTDPVMAKGVEGVPAHNTYPLPPFPVPAQRLRMLMRRFWKLMPAPYGLPSTLPLRYLDMPLSISLSEGSQEWAGINIDGVHTILLFIETTGQGY